MGKRLFEQCIRGILAQKTVVLVTNQLQYLPLCDRVVVLRSGKIEGTSGMNGCQSGVRVRVLLSEDWGSDQGWD